MREITSTITTKGQVTIPIEVRRLLGVKSRDRVAFIVQGEKVELRKTESVVARTAGALRGNRSFRTDEELRETAEIGIAKEAVRRMGD
jgi:AbrB family looped-hinge helix DNA binding protein